MTTPTEMSVWAKANVLMYMDFPFPPVIDWLSRLLEYCTFHCFEDVPGQLPFRVKGLLFFESETIMEILTDISKTS